MSFRDTPDDSSICLGVDASTLSMSPEPEVVEETSIDKFRYDLDRYGKLDRPIDLQPQELSPQKTSKEFSPEVVSEDDEGDWVICPHKDDVPDADYAPHLRKRRPKKPGNQTLYFSDTRPDNLNETNDEPQPVVYTDIALAIGLGILRLSLEILASCN